MLEWHTPGKLEAQEVKAFKHLSSTAFACAADAQQALVTMRRACRPPSWPRAPSTPPHAMAMRLAARQVGIDPQSCFILATNALDATILSPQELFADYKGQIQ